MDDVTAAGLMGVREAASRLGVHENTVRNWEKRGILRALRLPGSGHRRFDARQVEQMRKEMLTQLAPFEEGRPARFGFSADARIVHGDDVLD